MYSLHIASGSAPEGCSSGTTNVDNNAYVIGRFKAGLGQISIHADLVLTSVFSSGESELLCLEFS